MLFSLGKRVEPNSIPGSMKYGKVGNCEAGLLGGVTLPEESKENLAYLANHGVARGTWSSYRTAERMLLQCLRDNKRSLSLPVSRDDTLLFIDWLVRVRGVKGTTINSYLSGIRQLHIIRGMEPPVIRDGFVNLVIKGKMNRDAAEKRASNGRGRLPVTLNVMLLLKNLIRKWEKPVMVKLLVWAVCTLAFAGSFRIHELLCKEQGQFDPNHTLLTEDVTEKRDSKGQTVLNIKLKCPKESRTAAPTIVDVFETEGSVCPVKAWTRWRERTTTKIGSPLFRLECGLPITGKWLNGVLKSLLEPYVDYSKGKITTHSFRAGIPTMLAAAGHDDEEIKKVGRWSSNAMESYLKLERTKRVSMAKKIREMDN